MDPAAPCRTIYIRNLPEKLNKTRLRALLHALLSTYGNVVGIVAEKTMKLRGQAFVTFEHQSSATVAVRKLHASSFMGRQISITYAKAVSEAFQPRSEEQKQQFSQLRNDQASKKTIQYPQQQNGQNDSNLPPPLEGVPAPDEPPPQFGPPVPPNRILFVDNLPSNAAEVESAKPVSVAMVLTDLFARFAGFMEVRMAPGKNGIAFVEFDAEQNAAIAMSGLQGHGIGSPLFAMRVAFANK